MPSFAAQHSLFRAYDIRGSRQHFTDDFIHALGNAFAYLYQAQPSIYRENIGENSSRSTNEKTIVVVGHDVRDGSGSMAQIFADILSQHGLQVIQLGLVTTPMMIFWAEQYQGHGIIVTASHSAKDILGVKWLVNHISPSSADIQTLYQQLASYNSQNSSVKTNDQPVRYKQQQLPANQVTRAYSDAITQVFKQIYQHDNQTNSHNAEDSQLPSSKLDLVVVIDCMHGATSNIAKPLFDHFCQNIIMMNDTPDGNFPTGNPDPTEPQRLKKLQQSVLFHQADIGIAFDGDGDRLMVVDNRGKVVTPDHLLYLLAKIAVIERPQTLKTLLTSAQVLFDIKCCHHLPKLISEIGATPVLSKTGSSLMRQQMQDSDGQIIFAGELSGHFIFNDSRFILYDDAMYAALRLLHWLGKSQGTQSTRTKSLADIIKGLPVIVSTADHYLPLPESMMSDCSIVQQLARFCRYLQQLVQATLAPVTSAAFIDQPHPQAVVACAPSLCTCSTKSQSMTLEQAQALLPVGTKLSCIDGVRLDFAHGFGVLRQSNTSQNLTVRFAGDSIDDFIDIQTRFAALCRPFNKTLAMQILAIVAE
ncbi:phosphomannomutase [Psychrobacter faecalis]|uniref:phosphomannomutase n=1 Tax=Psychrobacter faecalis TaxID=180588 RepID=UPI003FD20C81